MLAKIPLQVVEERVVLRDRRILSGTGPLSWSIGSGERDDRKVVGCLSHRSAVDAHGRCGEASALIRRECWAVIARVAPLYLVHKIRCKYMGFFKHPDRGLGCVGLAVVVRNWSHIPRGSRLTNRNRARLATDSGNH